MNKIHQCKISDFLPHINIPDLASKTGFCLRVSKKISPEDFVLSFFNVMLNKCYSLRQWATELSLISGTPVSFQAIAKRLQIRHLPFVKELLMESLKFQFSQHGDLLSGSTNNRFNRILIEDSSCIRLPDCLADYYPGSNNQFKQKKAIGRIHLCIDLLSNSYTSINLKSYRDHDTTHADKILNVVQEGDLILRDLGYSVINIFGEIDQLGAYFINRLHPNWSVLDPDNETVMNLPKMLKKLERQNKVYLDKEVKIGKKDRVKLRLVCIKLTQSQAQKRRRHARKNGNRNKQIKPDTLYLMDWNIFVTNIPEDELEIEQVYKYYSLRWHIELIFKNWKSHFRIHQIFSSCRGKNYIKPELLLYLCLCFVVLIYNRQFIYFQKLIYEKTGRLLSPLKFAQLLINQMAILFTEVTQNTIDILRKNCCYDKRKDRQNIYEKYLFI